MLDSANTSNSWDPKLDGYMDRLKKEFNKRYPKAKPQSIPHPTQTGPIDEKTDFIYEIFGLKDFTHIWNQYDLSYQAVEKYLKSLAS